MFLTLPSDIVIDKQMSIEIRKKSIKKAPSVQFKTEYASCKEFFFFFTSPCMLNGFYSQLFSFYKIISSENLI